jgi:signal transduction histidine kinase/DNA-binding response OmpR family regulator
MTDDRLSPWRMEFAEAATERLFQQDFWPERSRQNSLAAVVWWIFVLSTALTGPATHSPWTILGVAAHILGSLAILWHSRAPRYRPDYEWILGGTIAALSVISAWMLVLNQFSNSVVFSLFVLAPILVSVGFHLRSVALWACVALILSAFGWVLWEADLDSDAVWLFSQQIFMAAALGLLVQRLLGSSRRQAFARWRQAKQLNEDLARAKAEAEQANQAKRDFLATISHEIRTPMNGVLGLTHLLRQTELQPRQQDYMEAMEQSARSLLTLVSDLLDFSKIEAGRMEIQAEPFDWQNVARQTIEMIRPLTGDKPVTWHAVFRGEQKWVRGDALRFRQVLANLLSNAVKFTERGEITLTASSELIEPDLVRLKMEVKDTGRGIAVERQKSIFQPFNAKPGEGVGLGLGIARQLVERMGGDLTVMSEAEVGSCFAFTLTWPSAPEGKTAVSGPAGEVRPDLRLLLVEDNRINALVAVDFLRGLGMENIASATSAEEARPRIQTEKFDVILMDCSLPEMDGWELTQHLRREPGPNQHTPVVAMTAYVSEADRARCTAAGMNEFLAKPLDEGGLREVLQRVMGSEGDPFDGPAFRRQMGGREEVCREALRLVIAELPEQASQLRRARTEGQSETVKKILHKMQGTAATLHANEWQKRIVDCQKAEAGPMVWDELEKATNRLFRRLADEAGSGKNGGA